MLKGLAVAVRLFAYIIETQGSEIPGYEKNMTYTESRKGNFNFQLSNTSLT